MTIQQYAAIGTVIVTIIIVITAAIIVLRKLGGIGSLGPLKWKEKEEQSKSNEYLMNREKELHDEECKAECRKATNKLRTRITNEFRQYGVCTMTRRAVAAAILNPLYTRIQVNHFTEFLMPDKIEEYKKQVFEELKDEFEAVYYSNQDNPCNLIEFPEWHEVERLLLSIRDAWIDLIKTEVVKCSGEKIKTYEKWIREFKDDDNTSMVKITSGCIEKNEKYIRELRK
ncbi:MAG: hypothetical protein LBQ88_05680 [Treponema sp.]|jgi:hypothetical protein|nr:hypothetical protein [Treponema sp.]